MATYSAIAVGGWVMRREKLINLVKEEKKHLWMKYRIQTRLLKDTRAAALHFISAEREFSFPVSSACFEGSQANV